MLVLVQLSIILALIFAAVAIIGSMAKAASLIGQVKAYERQMYMTIAVKVMPPRAERMAAPVIAASMFRKKNMAISPQQKSYGTAMAGLQLAAA